MKIVFEMDSQLLIDSYKRYKSDTTTFLAWLSDSAASCGFQYPQTPEPTSNSPAEHTYQHSVAPATLGERLREKNERKALKKASKKALKTEAKSESSNTNSATLVTPPGRRATTRELLIQAKLVADNQKIKIPQTHIKIIKRAVAVRKLCAECFQDIEIQEEDSNESHRYFIGVLEEIIEILTPRSKDELSKKPAPSSAQSPMAAMGSRFKPLSVDDVEDVLEQPDNTVSRCHCLDVFANGLSANFR